MARLSIGLLGSFSVTWERELVTGFVSDKVRALLAYLAVEADRPHRRQVLAGLLWPQVSERAARTSLRTALANLRRIINDAAAEPPYLCVDHYEIQFNREARARIDVAEFRAGLATARGHPDKVNRLVEAVGHYRGPFLEGFSLADSAAFEEWVLVVRQQLQQMVLAALEEVLEGHLERGDLGGALPFAHRLVDLVPWHEQAHRKLMRLLALDGQREAALLQYEACRRHVVENLGIAPTAETTELYHLILAGDIGQTCLERTLICPTAPAFIGAKEEPDVEAPALFVAREGSLARLDNFLDRALKGRGQVGCVIGGPGRGKTALLRAFGRRATGRCPDLLVASGRGNAYGGNGDPYLPFRDIMSALTGEVETHLAVGTMTREQARRLRAAAPVVVQAVLEHAPHVVGTILPRSALLVTAAAVEPGLTPWLGSPDAVVKRRHWLIEDLAQSHLFQQFSHMLQALAKQHPLLLLLDDMQWADSASSGLLFHLGLRLSSAKNRILIVCAYRPEEIELQVSRGRHPLAKALAEFKRRFGDVWLDLSRVEEPEERAFINAFLDSEPNCLTQQFRETLFRRTRGHPLFTIELLRTMQERGDLVHDEQARWIVGPNPDWNELPAAVAAVIEERVSSLGEDLYRLLSIASVEGETFTAQVVSAVGEVEERSLLRMLSRRLERQHRLVHGQGEQAIGSRRLSRYRFAHGMYQQYLYENLDPVERRLLHEKIAAVLEGCYEGRLEKIARQLAGHYSHAGAAGKALEYSLMASDRALETAAH